MRQYKSLIACAGLAMGLACTGVFAQPVNDTCANAIPIGLGAVNGVTTGAANDGNASCGNSSVAPDVYYTFIAPATCTYEVSTCDGNTDFDTSVSVHSACPARPDNTIACNDDGATACDPLRSRLTFNGTINGVYTIRVSGHGLAAGKFTLAVRQIGRPSNDTCTGALPISGGTGFLTGDTTCALSDGYQTCLIDTTNAPSQFWRWTSPGNGFVTFDTCTGATQYDTYLSVSTDCPHTNLNIFACNDDACGRRSSITFPVVIGASYIVRVSGYERDRGVYSLAWNFAESECPNDTCEGAQPISLGAVNGSTRFATAGEHISCFENDTPDVYYRFRSPVETFVTFDTCSAGTSFDTVLSVHSACPVSDANIMTCNDDTCDIRSSVRIRAKPGVDYWVRVAGFRDSGEFTLRATAQLDAVVFDPSTLGEYYLLHDNQTMQQFREQAGGLAGYMATLSSFSENQFVTKAVMGNANVSRSAAFGLSDELTEGTLRWDSLDPVEFTFMGNGQPDNTNGAEDHFHIYDPIAGLWNDYPDNAYPNLFGVVESDRGIVAQAINPENGNLYVLFKASSWEGAQARAQAMGGNLTTINGPAENEFVRSHLANADGAARRVWIGLNDALAEGAWRWADGSGSTFANYAAGEPNNYEGNENYVEMNPSTGHWNDVCNIELGRPIYGVAEIALPNVMGGPIRNPAGCGSSYLLLSPSNFYPAHFAAEALGGHIVTINNAQENEFIRGTFADSGGGRRLWLGATDRDDDGNYTWLNGDPFAYTNYLAGEPNNFGGNEDYLEMFDPATGVWNDMSTLDPSAPLHYAVVEIEPNCPCDWNVSGEINSQDFFDFLSDFFKGGANFNCDDATNSQDFFDFLTCFFNGCEA